MTKKKESKGLGDVLKEVIEATGMDKVHAAITSPPPEGCTPCTKRAQAANKLIPDVRPKAVYQQVKAKIERVFVTYIPKDKIQQE